MMRLSRVVPRSIAGKLYLLAALAVLVVSAFSAATVNYARNAERVVQRLESTAIRAAEINSELAMLLERHHRLISAANKTEIRQRYRSNIWDAGNVLANIADLTMFEEAALPPGFAGQFAQLKAQTDHVLRDVASGDRMRTSRALADYTQTANRLRDQMDAHRWKNLSTLRETIADLRNRAKTLIGSILVAALAAACVTGLVSYYLVEDIVARVKSISRAMRLLAGSNTDVRVPSLSDSDEIGEMARSVQIFKSNAVNLMGSKRQIEKLNGWLDIALNNMTRGLSMFDAGRRLVVCNSAYREIYALPPWLTEPGTPLAEILDFWCRREGLDLGLAGGGWHPCNRDDIGTDGHYSRLHTLPDGRMISVDYQQLRDGGWVDLHEDVTEERLAEARIEQLATTDAMTGLANRHRFMERLSAALSHSRDGDTFAVLWLDLDRFKDVNDGYGHPAGDVLLKLVAERLLSCVREVDQVARLGGDEFAILVSGSSVCEAAALTVAQRITALIEEPFAVIGHTVHIGVSIGIAMVPRHGATADDIIRNADIALYQAKSEGRGTPIFFQSEFEQKANARRRLEVDLKTAINEGQLELYYQPIISLASRDIVACEALMRWRHPDRGFISPAEFIPIAEETGLIRALGKFAIRHACRDASAWPGSLKVAINLSAAQFTSFDLVTDVLAALAETGLVPNRLEFEVTESLLLRDESKTHEILHKLRDMGVSIALDDFGTGYASLSYLTRFPFDKIKIDQTFVRDLPDRPDCVAIVRAVAALAANLGMTTVAEGIETERHLQLVEEAGCDLGQGYLFCRPVPNADFLAFIGRSAPVKSLAQAS